MQHHLKRREVRDIRAAYTRNLFVIKNTSDSAGKIIIKTVHFKPEYGVHFAPELPIQFKPEWVVHFAPELPVQFKSK